MFLFIPCVSLSIVIVADYVYLFMLLVLPKTLLYSNMFTIMVLLGYWVLDKTAELNISLKPVQWGASVSALSVRSGSHSLEPTLLIFFQILQVISFSKKSIFRHLESRLQRDLARMHF